MFYDYWIKLFAIRYSNRNYFFHFFKLKYFIKIQTIQINLVSLRNRQQRRKKILQILFIYKIRNKSKSIINLRGKELQNELIYLLLFFSFFHLDVSMSLQGIILKPLISSRRTSLIYLFRRACIPRSGNCDHRPKDCCYSSSCRCNLWGSNCRCQRMGLFQKWG